MSKVTYSGYSPYAVTPQSSWYLDLYVDRGFTSDITDYDFTITTRYQNRPDLLAYDLYGKVTLWWIFSQTDSTIVDPIFDMVAGKTISIPLTSRVKSFFG